MKTILSAVLAVVLVAFASCESQRRVRVLEFQGDPPGEGVTWSNTDPGLPGYPPPDLQNFGDDTHDGGNLSGKYQATQTIRLGLTSQVSVDPVEPTRSPPIIPWFDYAGDPNQWLQIDRGIAAWIGDPNVGEAPLATTFIALIELARDDAPAYARLHTKFPRATFIPCAGANQYIDEQFDNVAGMQRLADRARSMMRVFGATQYAVDFEPARIAACNHAKRRGIAIRTDWVRVEDGLRRLPPGAIYYPTLSYPASKPDEDNIDRMICSLAIAAQPVTWTTQAICDRGNPGHPDADSWLRWLRATKRPILALVYVYPRSVRSVAWEPEELPALFKQQAGNVDGFLVYPGTDAFGDQSERCAKALRRVGR